MAQLSLALVSCKAPYPYNSKSILLAVSASQQTLTRSVWNNVFMDCVFCYRTCILYRLFAVVKQLSIFFLIMTSFVKRRQSISGKSNLTDPGVWVVLVILPETPGCIDVPAYYRHTSVVGRIFPLNVSASLHIALSALQMSSCIYQPLLWSENGKPKNPEAFVQDMCKASGLACSQIEGRYLTNILRNFVLFDPIIEEQSPFCVAVFFRVRLVWRISYSSP